LKQKERVPRQQFTTPFNCKVNVRELFIYYRTTLENAEVLQTAALAMQARLRARHPGLQARLMCCPEPANGLLTWMETYALPSGSVGINESLQHDIEVDAQAALPALIIGRRHVEVFTACAL
jgi:hypothetical protein